MMHGNENRGQNNGASPYYQQSQPKRVHFSPLKDNDTSLNEREVNNYSTASANFGLQKTAAYTNDHFQSQQLGRSRPTGGNSISPADWSRASGGRPEQNGHYNTSKSPSLATRQLKLPDKLQKLRDRVKRDRSANALRDQSREDSLYGRKKQASDIDKECQRLRESYGKLRKNSNSSMGANGFTPELLQKQNFKEDPFDDRDASFYAQRSRGSASYDRYLGGPGIPQDTLRASDKENGMFQNRLNVTQSHDPSVNLSGQNQINKYKRTQQKSLQQLANYQQKYERLEKNYKKFSNNIKHANQTEQIIEDLKFRTAVSMMVNSAKKKHYLELRAGFRQWRVCSGVALKQYENQEKLLIMARCCQKMQSKLRNFQKIKLYQHWKKLTFSSGSSNFTAQSTFSRERIASILSEVITNSDNFNRCVESDKYLSLILSCKLQEIFQSNVLASDLLFYSNDTQETLGEEPTRADLKVYHDATGDQIDYTNAQIVGQSILGRVLIGQQPVFDAEWHPIQIVESIQMDPAYNPDIDEPINSEKLLNFNQNQTNAFNRVKGLGAVYITFQAPLRLGILRLFFESHKSMTQMAGLGNSASMHLSQKHKSINLASQSNLTSFQIRLIKNLTEVLPQFVQRIFEVRTQINSLAINSMDQQEQMREMENINCINQKVRDFQRRVIDINDYQALIQTVKEEIERALSDGSGGFELEGISLRQIVMNSRESPGCKDEYLLSQMEGPDKDLVRYYDHTQEDEEILEDFLDHKKEYYIHQMSICPKIPSLNQSSASVGTSQTLPSFGGYTFILQIQNRYPVNNLNKNQASLMLSPGSKMLSHALHEQSAISAQVNPLNSFVGGTINFGQSLPKRQHLDSILKHRLSLYFRSIVPILMQSLKISSKLIPKVMQLESSLKIQSERAMIVDWLQEYSSSKGLIQQLDQFLLHQELKEAIRQILSKLQLIQFTGDQSESLICLLLDQSMISRPQFRQSHWQFCGFLHETERQIFEQLIVSKFGDLFGAKKLKSACQIAQTDSNLFEVNAQVELLPRDWEQLEDLRSIPLVNPSGQNLIGHLIVQNAADMNELAVQERLHVLHEILCQFLLDLSHKRHTYQGLQEQHNKLLHQLEGEQVSKEAKDLISSELVIPYSRKPSLKVLGECIDNLSEKLVQNCQSESNSMDEATFGQEINQIAYFKQGTTFIEDVRLYNTYAQVKLELLQNGQTVYKQANSPDEMLQQSFIQQQQIVYEDEVLSKVVMLYPFVTVSHLGRSIDGFQYQMSQVASHHGLVLRFVLDNDQHVQKKLQNINIQLINVIQPVLIAILQGGVLTKENLALSKMSQIMNRHRHSHFQHLMYYLRDLKSKNVYNFTRSNLYTKLAKSKRFMELKEQLNSDLDHEVNISKDSRNYELFDMQQRRMTENQQIQYLIRQALKVMNARAHKYKQSCFRRFVIGTRQDVYGKMSKKKKKATCSLASMYTYFVMRRHLNKFAINTKTFKYVKNPRAKKVGAALCLFRNFRVVRERLGFLKLKKHMNMQLRASMTSCQESDKDLFIQLNQILLSSFQQEGGLDGGLSYALGEVFNYIKTQTYKELYIKDIGRNVADDSFTGHIDEVIVSIKSGIFQSGGGQTGNILNTGPSSQKSRIFICKLQQPGSSQNNSKVASVLRINNEYNQDSEAQFSHQQHLLNQIESNNAQMSLSQNPTNLDQCDDSEHIGEGNSYGCPFQKYVINSKRDLINLMLQKSNGIIFNFQNIQQSLSDVFLGQQSKHRDQNVGNRFQTVKRSKSALIIPMFDVTQQTIIGSFELYRYHQQIFSADMEARFEFFSKRMADFVLLYGQLKAQQYQIEQLRLQMSKSIRPVGNLSSLLKNVYLNAPNNHFPGAAHVLPIIIMKGFRFGNRFDAGGSERSMSQNTNYHEMLSESGQIGAHMQAANDTFEGGKRGHFQKLAFFYQFKDNHIYNFDYEGTFIDEIMENKCILEMCPKNQMVPDEGPDKNNASRSGFSNGQQFKGIDNNFDLQSSTMSLQSVSGLQGRASQRIEGSGLEKVHSVTSEPFKYIVYYPIFDVVDETNIVAIFEVGFKKHDKKSNAAVLTNETQHYLDQFRSHLDQFRVRLASFCKSIENMNAQKAAKKRARTFQIWKNATILAQYKEQYITSQQQSLRNQEQCYTEYMQNLESINTQLQAATDEKDRLHRQIDQYSVEKRAKLKFLATSLVSSQNLFHKLRNQQLRQAFTKWQYNVSIRKIAEAAFTRVLQINHRHSRARVKTGVFLLKQLLDERSISTGFQCILHAAHMKRHNNRGDRFGYGPGGALAGADYTSADCAPLRQSRSRTRMSANAGNESYILNNITSLLSPENMKKIEQKNLYQKHINSFYLPQGQSNHSAMTIGRQMNFMSGHDGQSMPLIQLKPEEVVKDVGSTHFGSTQDKSRYTGGVVTELRIPNSSSNLEFLRNDNKGVASRYYSNKSIGAPAATSKAVQDNLNRSQIEYSRGKRDYSPILTTSKYDIKSLYDPLNVGAGGARHSASSIHRNQPGQKKKSFHRSAHSQTACLKRYGGSSLVMAGSGKGLGSRVQGSMHMTKCELQKQLYIKQKQLTLLRKQMDTQAANNNATSGQGRDQRNPRFVSGNRSRSNPSAECENLSRGAYRSGGKASLGREFIQPSNGQLVGFNGFTDTSLSKQEQETSFEKYARINGRDCSPPVRLHAGKSAANSNVVQQNQY